MGSMSGMATARGFRTISASSGSSQPSLTSQCESMKATTSPAAASTPRTLARISPTRSGSRSTRVFGIWATLASRFSGDRWSNSEPSSTKITSSSNSGGVRSTIDHAVRSSVDRASLKKTTITDVLGMYWIAGYRSARHALGRVSGPCRRSGSRSDTNWLNPFRSNPRSSSIFSSGEGSSEDFIAARQRSLCSTCRCVFSAEGSARGPRA
mmetsp:Transcript_27590/g.82619  ORF Transcript_27590/g.82619 Transcript_27590/m.82619 type:complete len:210 (-) Transcript_27590:29-658(-)